MVIPTNAQTTYDTIGIREDLSDIIYDISPTETPFISMIADQSTATAKLHEWQTDSLAAAASNAVLEGDDTTATAVSATTRATNRCQISKKVIAVSGTSRAVDTAGRDDEYAYQMYKRSEELKRDMELVVTQNQAAVTGSTTIAPQLRSLEAWFSTNTQREAGGADGTTTQAATDGTTPVAISEAVLRTLLQSVFNSGGNPDYLMVGPFNKRSIGDFGSNNTRYVDAGENKVVAGIDVYESDFGTLQVVPNRFQRERTAFALDSQFWSIAYLRPFMEESLAKTGDSDKGHVLAEYTLEARNEAASGVYADLTTS